MILNVAAKLHKQFRLRNQQAKLRNKYQNQKHIYEKNMYIHGGVYFVSVVRKTDRLGT